MTSTTYHPSPRSQLSHELRIPLARIMGMVYFLHDTTLTQQQKEYLVSIQSSAECLLSAQSKVDDLLLEVGGGDESK